MAVAMPARAIGKLRGRRGEQYAGMLTGLGQVSRTPEHVVAQRRDQLRRRGIAV